MHATFSNVGILFIDEKSMVGQKTFTMVSKRLQEARSHYKDKPFGNSSVVLLGDFQQLSPVCDAPLFMANAVNPSGYDIYPLFDKAITFTELVRQGGADQTDIRVQLTSLGEGVFREGAEGVAISTSQHAFRNSLPLQCHPCICREKRHDQS